MRIGDLDRRITLIEEQETQSPTGAPVRAWVDVATVWASMRSLPGKERWQAPQALAERVATWSIRWRTGVNAGINEKMRFRHRGRIWRIDGLSEMGRMERWEISATALEGQQ